MHFRRLGKPVGALFFSSLLATAPVACRNPSESLDLAGEYVQPQSAVRLTLNSKDRTLMMTEGTEILSYGTYFVKWKHLYCTRENKQIIIGRVKDGRIETEIGAFIRTRS